MSFTAIPMVELQRFRTTAPAIWRVREILREIELASEEFEGLLSSLVTTETRPALGGGSNRNDVSGRP